MKILGLTLTLLCGGVDKGIAFLKKNKERPVYLHLWLNDVHDAHNPAPGEAGKYAEVEYGRDDSCLKPGLEKDRSPNLALRDGKWKCPVNADGTDLELYDFSKAQDEQENVAPEHPEVAEEMAKRLLAWRKSLPVLGGREGTADER